MIARITERSNISSDTEPECAVRERTWMAQQQGFCGGYHLLESDTGRALSVTLWENDEALTAADHALEATRSPRPASSAPATPPSVRVVRVSAVF